MTEGVGFESMDREGVGARCDSGDDRHSRAASPPESKCHGATSYKTRLETGLLVLAWIGFFVPLIWADSPAFSFAEFPLLAGPLVAGVMCLGIGLWLFYRSHADLGSKLVDHFGGTRAAPSITQGVYRRIRHPM